MATDLETKGWEITGVEAVVGSDDNGSIPGLSMTRGFIVLAKAIER